MDKKWGELILAAWRSIYITVLIICGLAALAAYYHHQSLKDRALDYALSQAQEDRTGLTAFLGPFWSITREPTYNERIVVKKLHFPRGLIPGKTDYHARFMGVLEVEQGGAAGFDIKVDDGFRLRVNGKTLAEDIRLQPVHTKTVQTGLDPGQHLISLYYFQAKNEAVLEVGLTLPPGASHTLRPLSPQFDLAAYGALRQRALDFALWLRLALLLFVLVLLSPLTVYTLKRFWRYADKAWQAPALPQENRYPFAPWKKQNRLALLALVLLALFFTYPLVQDLATAFPCDFGWDKQPETHRHSDTFQFVWNIWWYKTAMLNGQNPFFTDQIYHPFGTTLAYHTTVPAFSAPGAVFSLIMGVVPAYNLMYLLTLIFTGYNLYFLMRYMGIGFAAALLAGCIFAFNPYHLGKGLNTMNQFSLLWVPMFLWAVMRACRSPERRALWAWVGLLLALNYYAGNYAFFYCCFFGLAFVVLGPMFFGLPKLSRVTFAGWGIAALCAALAAAPLAWQVIEAKLLAGGVVGLPEMPSMSWKQLFTRPLLHPWFSREDAYNATQNLRSYWHSYLGIPLAAACVLSLLNQARLRLVIFFGLCGLLFTSLTLNPSKIWSAIFSLIPMLSDFRGFDTFIGMMLFCAAILGGLFFEYLLKLQGSIRKRRVGFGLAGLMILVLAFEFWSLPYPVLKYKPPREVLAMAADPVPGAVLELPVLAGFPWVGPNRLMLYQTTHNRPRFVSTLSRIPKHLHNPYWDKYPMLEQLSRGLDLDAAKLREELDELRVRYVVLERPYYLGEPWLINMVKTRLPWKLIGQNNDFIYYQRPLDTQPGG
jgi:hypothetical protein